MPNALREKLAISTIAFILEIWYHMRIQVDCAYSTF